MTYHAHQIHYQNIIKRPDCVCSHSQILVNSKANHVGFCPGLTGSKTTLTGTGSSSGTRLVQPAKRITNHSARKFLIQKLNDNGIPPNQIMQVGYLLKHLPLNNEFISQSQHSTHHQKHELMTKDIFSRIFTAIYTFVYSRFPATKTSRVSTHTVG